MFLLYFFRMVMYSRLEEDTMSASRVLYSSKLSREVITKPSSATSLALSLSAKRLLTIRFSALTATMPD